MIRSILKFTLFLFLFSSLSAQSNEIDIIYSQDEEGISFIATNNKDVQYEVTLIIEPNNLSGYEEPVVKLIKAKSTVEMARLTFVENKGGSFEYSYTFKPSLTEDEKKVRDTKLKGYSFSDDDDLDTGIILFTREGCPRCHFSLNYLMENNIEFVHINITENDDMNLTMWEILREDNPDIKSVTMPVILDDGDLLYNIDKLEETLNSLGQ